MDGQFSRKIVTIRFTFILFFSFSVMQILPEFKCQNSPLMYIDDFCIQTPFHTLGFPTSLNLSILSVLASTYCHVHIFSQRTKICLFKFSGDYLYDGHIIPLFQVSQTQSGCSKPFLKWREKEPEKQLTHGKAENSRGP